MKKSILFLLFLVVQTALFAQEENKTAKVYTYPFKQGDAKWKSFKSAKDRIQALQIPDSIRTIIPTDQLLDLCLDFPYLTDMYAFDDFQKGFKYMISEYNGFDELLDRGNAIDALLDEYDKIESVVPSLLKATEIEKGGYSFRCDLLVKLIKLLNERKGLSKSIVDRFSAQTKRNADAIKRYSELFGTMCQEAILTYNDDISESSNGSWYEGQICGDYKLYSRRTPANSIVKTGTLNVPDISSFEKKCLKNSVESNYNVTVVAPATRKYNCHSYAWHMSDGHSSDEVWIGFGNDKDEEIYWTDGSYYSVPPAQATHVSYSNNHSAIRLSNGLYRSKWGEWPLVEHDSLNVPVNYGVPVGFYKKFGTNLTLSGPSFFCSHAFYALNDPSLPSGYTISWSLSDNYYNTHNRIMSNYPEIGHCLILRDDSHDLINDTLTATIRYNGNIVKKVIKPGIYTYEGFKGSYTSGGGATQNIDYTLYFHIKANATTHIVSPNFYGATVSYSSSAAIPSIWAFSPTYGDLTFVTTSASIPVVINVHDVCGNDYVLYAFPSSSYSMNVSNGGSDVTVTLVADGDDSKDFTLDEPCTIEIRNATTGELMAMQSSTNRSKTISTTRWSKGVYIVKVTIGKEELTEKFIVK